MFDIAIQSLAFIGCIVIGGATLYGSVKYYTDKTSEERTAQVQERERTKRHIAQIEANVDMHGFQLETSSQADLTGLPQINSAEDLISYAMQNPQIMDMATKYFRGNAQKSTDAAQTASAETQTQPEAK